MEITNEKTIIGVLIVLFLAFNAIFILSQSESKADSINKETVNLDLSSGIGVEKGI